MTSNSPLEEVSKGFTKGLLEWSIEKITNFVTKLRNHQLALVQDDDIPRTINNIKDTPAYGLYKNYVKNKNLRYLIKLGLALRHYEQNKNSEKIQKLRDRIINVYGSKGLHIAQVVENEILSSYIETVVNDAKSEHDVINKVENVLNNVDDIVKFIQISDDVITKSNEIKTYLSGSHPDTYILASKSNAIKVIRKIENSIKKDKIIKNLYDLKIVNKGNDYIVFIERKVSY
ncbi:MAG: hypothetical protein ACP5RS_07265 [Thermoplasmata archaeon]